MEYKEFHSRLMVELDRLFAERARGTQAKLQRQMGVNPTYFKQWRAGANIPIPRLLEVLDLLDVDVFHFLVRAFQPEDTGDLIQSLILFSSKREWPKPVTEEGKRALALVEKDMGL